MEPHNFHDVIKLAVDQQHDFIIYAYTANEALKRKNANMTSWVAQRTDVVAPQTAFSIGKIYQESKGRIVNLMKNTLSFAEDSDHVPNALQLFIEHLLSEGYFIEHQTDEKQQFYKLVAPF